MRLLLWSAALALAGITLFSVYGVHAAGRQLNTALIWCAVLLLVGTIMGANFCAIRMGLDKVERELVFVLTDKELVRQRSGWPDVRIGLSEIESLRERRGWLVVERADPARRIAIPKEVEGFALLRAQLAKHRPVVKASQVFPLGLFSSVGSLVCWAVVLLSKDVDVAMTAGVTGVALLGWESFRLYRQLGNSPKRIFLLIFMGFSWAAALFIFHLRVSRG